MKIPSWIFFYLIVKTHCLYFLVSVSLWLNVMNQLEVYLLKQILLRSLEEYIWNACVMPFMKRVLVKVIGISKPFQRCLSFPACKINNSWWISDDFLDYLCNYFNAEIFRQIFHVLDLMKMDMVNFTIRSLRPHLQRQLVDYERTKFQEILEETPSK